MPSLADLKAQILKDRRVTKDEAYQLMEEVMRGTVTQKERAAIHELLVDYGAALEPAARKELEKALGLSSKTKLVRAPSVREPAELKTLEQVLALVHAAGDKPTLFEVSVGDQVENKAFKGALSDALKAFIEQGNSSLSAKEAMALATGLSPGHFHAHDEDALFHLGDRLEVTVHYPDGTSQDTRGLVVSAGQSPLVLVVNKNKRYQLIRQEPKSREQLAVRSIVAGGV
jgi:hypothetical protein